MSTFSLTHKQQWLVAGLLLLLMIVTRSHIWMSHIQDASWAIFFLLGFYVRKQYTLPVFLLLAFALDLIVVESKGGQSYCFTLSYPFIFPAYAALWAAGRWLASHYSEDLPGFIRFVLAAVIGITVCDLVSSGGFYWFSGRFADVNMSEFIGHLATYLPMFMKTTLFHLGIAASVHIALVLQPRYIDGNSESKSG